MRTITLIPILGILAGACARQETNEAVPSAVEVAAVQQITTGSGVRYSATVEPNAQVAVAFRVGGYVETVAVEEGDRVTKGTVLARVRAADYREKLGQASASQAEAQAALVQATSDLARAKALFAANALTQPELDAAKAAVEVHQARVNRGRAVAGEAGLALGDTTLTAPISGVILRRSIEKGDLAQPGAPAFVLADTRTVKVLFGAPDTMIASLRKGAAVDVITESLPDHAFRGVVRRIAPSADPKTRSFDVEVHIDNPADELKPGMVAALEIGQGAAPFLAIPLDAVIRPPKASDGYAVYVVENDKAVARRVELGDPMGNLVALHAGLRRGERVVVSGPALLTEGQLVRVVNGGPHASR